MGLKGISKLCVTAALSASFGFAVTPPIGVASALGTFTLNDAKVEGNANIFDGSRLVTTTGSSRIYLESGTMLTLGTNSAAKFYKDHLFLEQGATRVEGMSHYAIRAASYRVESVEPLTEAVIRMAGGELQVATLTGSVNVVNARGALVSRVTAGTASAFDPRDNNTANPNPQQPAAQSGATAGTYEEEQRKRRKREKELFLVLGTALGGLGLAVDAILQPGSATPSSTSP